MPLDKSKSVSFCIVEPFTDWTFPKENILPEEKKIIGFLEKKFELSRARDFACKRACVLRQAKDFMSLPTFARHPSPLAFEKRKLYHCDDLPTIDDGG